jgi:chitin disaccharide deacetylase
MKLVIRADDVGYTDICNIGTFKTLEQGISTSADVMLDTPGTEDALLRLLEMPWISIGWHTHFWGSPVLDPTEVPSLVEEENGRIRFRKDLQNATSCRGNGHGGTGGTLLICRLSAELVN